MISIEEYKKRYSKDDLYLELVLDYGEEGLRNVFLDAVRWISDWEAIRDLPDDAMNSIRDLMHLEQLCTAHRLKYITECEKE